MKHSCYQECSVIWDFGCEMRRFPHSRKSDFRWHRFRFSPCLMRKRVLKSQATVAFLDSFQELNLEW